MQITHEEFIKKNNGKQIEVTGSANAKFQCVDLANAYIRDVLGFPIVKWTNAQDFPKKCLPPNYEYIKNSTDNFPLKGDIVIWSSKDNVGHIAICVEDGNTKNFKSFDQNWSKPLYCTLETHIYTGSNHKVIGWLRPKINNSNEEIMLTDNEKNILNFVREKSLTEGDVRKGFGYISDNVEKTISDLKTKVDNLTSKVNTLSGQLTADGKTASEWQKEYDSASAEVQTWKKKSLQASTFSDIVSEIINRLFKKQ